MSRAIQENMVALLLHDDTLSHYVRAHIDLKLYEGLYQPIASAAYDYLQNYGSPPKQHIFDLLEKELEADSKRSDRLRLLLVGLDRTYSEGGYNLEYVKTQIQSFVSEQTITTALVEAGYALSNKNEESVSKAHDILQRALYTSTESFDLGKALKDFDVSEIFARRTEGISPTGIRSLDKEGLGPARGELHVFVALPNRGKSWWLVNLGRRAAQRGQKVLHITLEMSAESCALRYMQCLFAIRSGSADPFRVDFERDKQGRLIGLDKRAIAKYLDVKQPDLKNILKEKLEKTPLGPIRIKQFASGTLTMGELYTYLRNLENIENFIPDLLILDYPDLMRVSSENLRIELGRTFVELRGLAVRKNLALATATQSNREGEGKKLITGRNLSEDFSKIMTCDVMFSYNQTDEERMLGLARLFVMKSRNTEAGQKFLISQNYGIGQFVLDDSRMPEDEDEYKDLVKISTGTYTPEDEDDDSPAHSTAISQQKLRRVRVDKEPVRQRSR